MRAYAVARRRNHRVLHPRVGAFRMVVVGYREGGGAIEIAAPVGVVGADGYWEGGDAIEIAVPADVFVTGGYWEGGDVMEIAAPVGGAVVIRGP